MTASPFQDDGEHLLAELARLDLLLMQQAVRARRVAGGELSERGLIVRDDELERLLARVPGRPLWDDGEPELEARVAQTWAEATQRVQARVEATYAAGGALRLVELAARCGLDALGEQLLMLALAPELDPRYLRIFGWLHDDLRRDRVSLALALDLFAGDLSRGLLLRRRLLDGAGLQGLLEMSESGGSGLYHPLRPKAGVVEWLVDGRWPEALWPPRVAAPAELILSEAHQGQLSRLSERSEKLYLSLVGPRGAGRRSFAAALCEGWGCPLFVVEAEALEGLSQARREARLEDALRAATLEGGALLWVGEGPPRPLRRALAEDRQIALFVAAPRPWVDEDPLPGLPPLEELRFPVPERALRVAWWAAALPEAGAEAHTVAGEAFRFHPGVVRAAAHTARGLAAQRGAPAVTLEDMLTAGRRHATPQLGALATPVSTEDGWDELVLPEDRKLLLYDIVRRVRLEHQVLDVWGFGRRSRSARGVAALFSGPPGTGKTMAAAIIARETGRDMFRIDLSQVVSKYIGETEKHLERVFSEAEASDVAIFFDEADSLFGKRTAVNDARDRYANLEVSYLLQRIDAYPGLVVLATNLRKNMDDAFTRRLDVIVEFPLPDEESRRRIWQRVWPEAAPVAEALDPQVLAKGLEISGGSIRNIALTSAYLAAEAGDPIGPDHVLEAARVEFRKLGKVLNPRHLLHQEARRA